MPNRPDQAGKAGLEKEAASLRKLVELNPHSEKYLRAYAEVLMRLERNIHADHILRKLHHLLLEQGETARAEEVEALRRAVMRAYSFARFGEILESAVKRLSILHRARRLHLDEGDYLFHENEDGSDVFLLLSGELCAWRHDPRRHQPVLICNFKPGAVIGDIDYFHNGKRSADLLASRPSRLLKFSAQQFSRLLLEHPEIQESWRRQAETGRRLFLLSMNEMLASLPENMRLYLARHGQEKTFPPFRFSPGKVTRSYPWIL